MRKPNNNERIVLLMLYVGHKPPVETWADNALTFLDKEDYIEWVSHLGGYEASGKGRAYVKAMNNLPEPSLVWVCEPSQGVGSSQPTSPAAQGEAK